MQENFNIKTFRMSIDLAVFHVKYLINQPIQTCLAVLWPEKGNQLLGSTSFDLISSDANKLGFQFILYRFQASHDKNGHPNDDC